MVGSRRRRVEGLQQESRQPQHADDAERRRKRREPDEVKTQLESIKKTDNPQPRIEAGGKVRVVVKKKFEKGYMTDWSDEIYTVQSLSKGKDDEALTDIYSHGSILERQAMHRLRDPNNTLNKYKNGMYARNELLLVKKALKLYDNASLLS